MTDPRPIPAPSFDYAMGSVPTGTMLWAQGVRGFSFRRYAFWSTETRTFEPPDDAEILFREESAESIELVYAHGKTVVMIELMHSGRARVTVAGETADDADKRMVAIRRKIPVLPEVSGRRPVTFWSYSQHGPQSRVREVDVPAWGEIDANYPESVREVCVRLINPTYRPSSAGQLVLWQGPPGTGKTYALRSLIWEWREWAEFHFIVDPEVFFGDKSDYMMEVLTHEHSEIGDDDEDAEGKWRILILEDSGEMLAQDAKARVGQALSRLLNVVDGLIGQGLKIMVLVTTNEETGALHPAVARSGRCAAQIVFGEFTQDEASAWLKDHGHSGDVTGQKRLTDLYDMTSGEDGGMIRNAASGKVGFTL